MIAGLHGTVVQVRLDGQLLLRCGPVVLEVMLPASQARTLSAGEELELYTQLLLSTASDQLRLFGFTTALSRELFAVLLSGSGIGPKVALALLDLGVARLVTALRDGDEKCLVSVAGVGPKLAKKIILELGEKLTKDFSTWTAGEPELALPPTTAAAAALDAVVALGYPRLRAEQALSEVRRDYDGEDPSAIIRRILGVLAG